MPTPGWQVESWGCDNHKFGDGSGIGRIVGGSRLNDYWVFVSNTPFSTRTRQSRWALRTGTFASPSRNIPEPRFVSIPVGMQGRYVRVQGLVARITLASPKVQGAVIWPFSLMFPGSDDSSERYRYQTITSLGRWPLFQDMGELSDPA